MDKEQREKEFLAFAKLWKCPRCGSGARVFMFCPECWVASYGNFELDHRGKSLSQGEWA